MSKTTWRRTGLFVIGVALGVAAGAWGTDHWRGVTRVAAAPQPAPAPVARALPAQPVTAACPGQPMLVPAAGGKDGKFDVLADFSNNRSADIGAFIVLGKEAAASGRPRDAEVAFLMACRLAQKLGAPAEQLADAKYRLGRHYAAQLALPTAAKAGDQLRQRARSLYEESRAVYVASVGAQHEKSRFAAEGLAALSASQATSVPAAASVPPPSTRTMGAAAQAPKATVAAPRQEAGPSFDCSRARSAPERLICRDAQLAQLDRELGRLHARAKRAAPDAADFKRRSDEAWLEREATCRDRECLLGWYAMRREELLDELDAGATSAAR